MSSNSAVGTETQNSDPTAMDVDELEEAHSGLEVDGRQHFSDPEALNLGYSNLEVAHHSGTAEGMRTGNLQVYHPEVAGNKDAEGIIPHVLELGEAEKANKELQSTNKDKRICGLSRRFFLVLAILAALLVVGGIVGGAVGGTQGKKTKASSTASSGEPGSSTVSGSPQSTTTPANTGIRQDSNLAALAWTVSSTRYQYRVYYQDDENNIKESAYDSSTGSWNISKIVDGATVSPGTSLAASSSRQASSGSDGVDINLYFIDKNLNIALVSAPLGVWGAKVATTTQPYTKSAQVKLAAYYHECSLCPNTTLLAYSLDGTIILYNDTSPAAWNGQQFTIETGAFNGSEVSFQPYSTSQWADQVNMYYQRSDNILMLASWFSSQYQIENNLDLSDNQGWQETGNNAVVGTMVANASFATLYFGDDGGSPAYVEVLTSGANLEGIQLFEWTPNSWMSPSMPNSIQTVTKGTSIAAHFYQRAYVLVNGILTQLAVGNDGSTWTVNAAVPTL